MNYNQIRKLIDQKGLTFKRFCDKIGMTPQGFEPAIEKETVPARVLKKMSEVLNVPVSYFFDETETVRDVKDSQIIDLQHKYIVSLEKRLEEYDGKPVKKAG